MDKAVSDKADRLSVDLQEKLNKDKKVKAVVERETIGGKLTPSGIVIKFSNRERCPPSTRVHARYSEQLEEPSRDASKGIVVLRMNQAYVENIKSYALKPGHRDHPRPRRQVRRDRATIIRKGDNIVVELPASSRRTSSGSAPSSGAPRSSSSSSWTSHAAQRRQPYMTKVAEVLKDSKYKDSGIEAQTESWSEKDSGQQHSDTFLRAEKREPGEVLRRAAGRVAGPAAERDRLRGIRRGSEKATPSRAR